LVEVFFNLSLSSFVNGLNIKRFERKFSISGDFPRDFDLFVKLLELLV